MATPLWRVHGADCHRMSSDHRGYFGRRLFCLLMFLRTPSVSDSLPTSSSINRLILLKPSHSSRRITWILHEPFVWVILSLEHAPCHVEALTLPGPRASPASWWIFLWVSWNHLVWQSPLLWHRHSPCTGHLTQDSETNCGCSFGSK